MDRLTRKELKSDRFALEVQHSVEYVTDHRRQLILWGGIAAVVVALAVGIFFYRNYQRDVRQEKLASAMQILNAAIGQAPNQYAMSFPTKEDQEKAFNKAFSELTTKYPGTDEALLAEFYIAAHAADLGKIDEATQRFKIVVDGDNKAYSSMAKLSLARIDASQGKLSDGEKLIQSVIDNPTSLVSKEQATIALAELIAPKDPLRARKLLEPLRGFPRGAVSRAALSALSDLDQKK